MNTINQIGEVVAGLERNPVVMPKACVDKLHYQNILTLKNCPTCKKVSNLEELSLCCDSEIKLGRCSKCGEGV